MKSVAPILQRTLPVQGQCGRGWAMGHRLSAYAMNRRGFFAIAQAAGLPGSEDPWQPGEGGA